VIVNLKTVPILLLLGCTGTDCGYPNVRFWASRHFGAMRNLVAIGTKRTSTKPRQSSSVYEYALIDCEPTISMTKRITPPTWPSVGY
jgi:hypothetical protein